jgi:Domain of unknown function (DUF4111)/Nucleotidyltransferase domain
MDVPTPHPIVDLVRDAVLGTTGGSLIGLYLYGSLATGDFEPDVSDIDLIAVLADVPDASLVSRLREMHARLAEAHRAWVDRIEVDYVSTRGLAECRTRTTMIARTSPGEPLHLIEAGRDFLLDWYPARRDGVALVGPAIDSLIPPIPDDEYRVEVRAYLAGFRDRFDEDAGVGSQSYAILTMCRGFYSITARERLSKREAGLRARRDFPKWDRLIDRALCWRDRQWDPGQPDGSTSVAETRAFIDEMASRLDLP